MLPAKRDDTSAFGTPDTVVVPPGRLMIIEHKQPTAPRPQGNAQLDFYRLAAAEFMARDV